MATPAEPVKPVSQARRCSHARFYEHSLKLWEGLSRDLNYNVMFSQRGVLNLGHSDGQMDAHAQRGNARFAGGAFGVVFE